MNAEPDSQLLYRALTAIAEMEASLAGERESSLLAVHSSSLLDALTNIGRVIGEERKRLDAIELIAPDMYSNERFHSRIISWLLDQEAHHGQAAQFTAALLKDTMAPPQFLIEDWSAAKIIQEWPNVVDGQQGYLDILILDKDHQNLIAIENKVFSQEHSNQLTRYRRALAEAYPDFTSHHIILSPYGVSPYWERDRKYWRPASYSVIHDAIVQVLETGIADPDANALLRIYATTIRRNVMSDTSIDLQARRIYLEHREALDRIFANKPIWIEDAKPWLKEAVAKHSAWRLDYEDARYVGFRAADWDEFRVSMTGTDWGSESNALLVFGFHFDCGKAPYLALEISPADSGNAKIRTALFDAVRQNPAVFKPTRSSLIDGWIILHMEPDYILDSIDYGPGWDDGTARRKIEAWIDRFAAEKFPEMNRIIVDCLRRHQES